MTMENSSYSLTYGS